MLPETPQLEAFLAVATTLHFGRAAERLHVTQSTVSHRIRKLEECVGVALFDRSHRSVQLTPAGVAYLKRVSGAVRDLDRAEQDARAVGSGRQGRCVIGYSGAASCTPLLDALEAVMPALPQVQFELQRRALLEQLDAVLSGELDLGSSFLPIPGGREGLEVQAVAALPLRAWVAADHPLARAERAPLSALAQERWIVLSDRAEAGFSSFLRRRGGGGQAPPIEADALDATFDLVRRGLGITVLPATPVAPPGVRGVPLVGLPAAQLSVFWRTGPLHPLVRALIEPADRSQRGPQAQPEGDGHPEDQRQQPR
ncbi:MAG: LysR family transcriptional regulator [Alphaproteobacteria bacterium]|nr:LysR family transcriptional regulator [Alphaproteobacteria bacterium]